MHLYSIQKVSFFFCQIINGILPLHLIMKLPLFNQIPSLIFANRITGCQIALKFKTAHDFAEKPEDIFSQLSLCKKKPKKWWPTMKTSFAEPKLFIFGSNHILPLKLCYTISSIRNMSQSFFFIPASSILTAVNIYFKDNFGSGSATLNYWKHLKSLGNFQLQRRVSDLDRFHYTVERVVSYFCLGTTFRCIFKPAYS